MTLIKTTIATLVVTGIALLSLYASTPTQKLNDPILSTIGGMHVMPLNLHNSYTYTDADGNVWLGGGQPGATTTSRY